MADNLQANDMLLFLTTNLTGVTGTELIELLDLADGLNLADDEQGLATDVSEAVQVIEDITKLMNLGANVVPQSMNDSSVLCPGFTTPGSCESFEELRRICPWSCERQKEECAYASPKTCEMAAFTEECPVTCRQLMTLSSQLPMTLEGAIQITSLTDGSAIKTHNLQGTVEEDCLCFNIFQPVCHAETGEMYANLCQAECRGAGEKIVACRQDSIESVMRFAEQASLSPGEVDFIGDEEGKQECSLACPRDYDPVCSSDNVYENDCHAKCDFVYNAKPCAENSILKTKGKGGAANSSAFSGTAGGAATAMAAALAVTSSLLLLSFPFMNPML